MRRRPRPPNEGCSNPSAVLVDAPSPLVGEGISAARHDLTPVRGISPHIRMPIEPLTRLRFAKPPSPTRGEGKRTAMNTQLLIQLLVNGLVVGTLYGVVAMSFVLIYKATQVVNFAQGELLLIGAWVCWGLLTKYQVPFCLGMPITLVFMFLFGIAIQIIVLRPMIGEPIISVIMVTIALSTVFSALMKWIFGVNFSHSRDLPDPEGQHSRSAGAERLSDEPRRLGGDDGRHGVVLPRFEIRSCDARHRLQPAGRAVARHFREERVCDGLGDLGNRLRRRRRGGGRRQRRLGRIVRLRRQGVPGGNPRRPRQRRRRGARWHHHRAAGKLRRWRSG